MIIRIRSLAFAVFLICSIALVGIFGLPVTLFGKPAVRATVKVWCNTILAALKLITGVSYRIEGAEYIPSGGAIVAANHQSMWETIALHALLPNPVMAFKKELLRIPVYGWWVRLAGHIAIDREGGAKALRAFTRAAKQHIESGAQVIIFPEGTRIAPGATTHFLPGVAGLYTAAGAPCTPAAHDSGRYWRHPGIERRPGVITLRFLPPIAPGLDRKTFQTELKIQIDAARPDLEPTQRAQETCLG